MKLSPYKYVVDVPTLKTRALTHTHSITVWEIWDGVYDMENMHPVNSIENLIKCFLLLDLRKIL